MGVARQLAIVALAACAGCTLVERVSPPSSSSQTLTRDECRATLTDDGDLGALQRAAEQSLDYYRRQPEDRSFVLLDRSVTVRELRTVLESLVAEPIRSDNAAALCDRFTLVHVAPTQPLLVTGYYEPELPARRRRTERFRYPLYELPDNLVTVDLGSFCPSCPTRRAAGRVRDGELVPYYSRAEIDAGVLGDHASVIAWLDDPVEVFFIHVQGSALLRFDDGVHMHVSYNGSNGRPYTSIGRVLVETGKLNAADVSLAAIKAYLRSHPDERDALLQRNERYVFFRTVPIGPVGSLGQPLTTGRSLAADSRVYPPGALVFITTNSASGATSRLALLQDSGIAISGDNRLDLFQGSGDSAAAIAGDMRADGELYFVLPR